MSKSTDVAVQETALPALVNPQAEALGNIDSGDISLPRLYKGEYQSGLVQDDVVPKGSIYVAAGPDDPDPQVIAEKPGDKVLVHVLKVWKGKSANVDDAGNVVKSGGEFRTWSFNDPDAPREANIDFHYIVVLPDIDPDVPVKLTMAKTSVPAAKKINFLLLKDPSLPTHRLAFELNTKHREGGDAGQKFKWFIWEARLAEAKQENIEAAANLAEMVNTVPVRNDIEQTAGTTAGPAI
jgi:hypothetical protein